MHEGKPRSRRLVAIMACIPLLVLIYIPTHSEYVLAPQLGPESVAVERQYHAGYLRGFIAGLALAFLLLNGAAAAWKRP